MMLRSHPYCLLIDQRKLKTVHMLPCIMMHNVFQNKFVYKIWCAQLYRYLRNKNNVLCKPNKLTQQWLQDIL